MNSSSYGHLGTFSFYAECLRCSNALVLRDIVCVLTILIMGACSCFHEMACVASRKATEETMVRLTTRTRKN